MITQDQLQARIDARKEADMFGFEWHEYLPHLEPARMQKYLKPDATTEGMPPPEPIERETLIAKMKDYMPFAFEKAHGQRGISSSRSIMHYVAWTWLAGDENLSKELEDDDGYEPYGLPLLRRICEHYGWSPKELGDDAG